MMKRNRQQRNERVRAKRVIALRRKKSENIIKTSRRNERREVMRTNTRRRNEAMHAKRVIKKRKKVKIKKKERKGKEKERLMRTKKENEWRKEG